MFWIGMFKKIILNNKDYFINTIKNPPSRELLKEMAQGMDDMADMVTYSRAWFYISKLDLKRRVDIDALINIYR
jgi:arsenate reductase-like glutaredoxin family protein